MIKNARLLNLLLVCSPLALGPACADGGIADGTTNNTRPDTGGGDPADTGGGDSADTGG